MLNDIENKKILLIYDKECPACNMYCNIVKIKEEFGELEIMDARENTSVRTEVTKLGWDIDQGMILKVEEKLFYGSDAIHALSLMSSQSGLFNRVNFWIFKSEQRSAIFYPILRFCRNLLLKLLGKSKINNLGLQNNERF